MKKIRLFICFLLALTPLALLQSCSNSLNVAPLSPNPSPQTILNAFATIGTNNCFEFPAGIQYYNCHLWVCNESTYLQEWATVGTAPATTIWTYNSGVSFTVLFGDGIDSVTGNVYACDENNNQIVVFDSSGNYLAVFGYAQMSVTTVSNPLGSCPYGVAVNSAGTTVYALGRQSNCVYVYSIGGTSTSPTYTYQHSFGNTGSGSATLNTPANLRVDSGGYVWVADTMNHRVAEYTGSGNYANSFTASNFDANFSPVDVLVDGSGNFYSIDGNANVVLKFNPQGLVVGQFGKGVLSTPLGVTTDGVGNFFVTNNNPQQIVEFH